jgi:hypothetical protein
MPTKPNTFSCRPVVEELEGRALPDATSFVQGLYANILQRPSPSMAEVNGWVSQIQSGVPVQAVSNAFIQSNEHAAVVVAEDYATYLNRAPSESESAYWTQQLVNGVSQDEVAAQIISSQEFLQVHGASSRQYVTALYETVLKREPDEAGLAYWVNKLGVTTNTPNRDAIKNTGTTLKDVADSFLASNEAHQREVDAIFADTLHRSPDEGGRNYWAGFLDNGGSENDMVASLVNSFEYLNAYEVASQAQ